MADDNMIKEIGSEQKTSGTISTEKRKVGNGDDSDLEKDDADVKIYFNSER